MVMGEMIGPMFEMVSRWRDGRDVDAVPGIWRRDAAGVVHEHPDAGIFHHPAWIRLIRDTYGYPMFAVCLKNDRKICAGIPFADVHSSTELYGLNQKFPTHCAR